MTDNGTIHVKFGHTHLHFPLAFAPAGYKVNVHRGGSNAHCGNPEGESKVTVELGRRHIDFRFHVHEESLTVEWEVFGNFQPESINLK